MRLTTFMGLFLTVAILISAAVSNLLNLQFANIMLGVAIGGALGRYAFVSPLVRVASFFVGFLLAWMSYGVRAAVMPADSMSLAIVAAVLFLVLTLIALATRNRLNLGSMILGVAAVSGAYEAAYNAAPYLFVSQSTASAAAVLVPVSLGWLAVALAQLVTREGETPLDSDSTAVPANSGSPDTSAPATAVTPNLQILSEKSNL